MSHMIVSLYHMIKILYHMIMSRDVPILVLVSEIPMVSKMSVLVRNKPDILPLGKGDVEFCMCAL